MGITVIAFPAPSCRKPFQCRASRILRAGHVLNLEEPSLFNETLDRSLAWSGRANGAL